MTPDPVDQVWVFALVVWGLFVIIGMELGLIVSLVAWWIAR